MVDQPGELRDHAVEVGRGYGLGPVVGRYVRETQGPARLALGMLLVWLVLAVCVVPVGADAAGTPPMGLAWLISGVALVLVVVLGRRFLRPGRHWWLYLYEGGFVALHHRGQVRDCVRWAELEQVDWEWSPHESRAGGSQIAYRFVLPGGRVVRLPVTFAAAPGSPPLADVVRACAVEPLARRALHLLAAGQPLVFGRVTVTPDGIAYGRKPLLRWDELAGWDVDDGVLTMERAAGRPRRLAVSMTEVERGWILVTLLAGRTRR